MNIDIFNAHLKEYVKTQYDLLEKLSHFKCGDFLQIPINCALITEDLFEIYRNDLVKLGIGSGTTVFYYFQILKPFSGETIQQKITLMKKFPGKSDRSLPKVNKMNLKVENDVLYVGKTDSNFPERLRQHLGLASSRTFALHLNAWADNLHLILNVMPLDFNQHHMYMSEQIENVFHFGLKPLLGRSGH